MRPEFSEFQFTYGLTREIENTLPLTGVPFLPTQRQEKDFPVDVGVPLGTQEFLPLLLQYKRSEALTRSWSNEWDDFNRQYYRFEVYPPHISDQHNKLIELAADFDYVYYVAPAFYTGADYRRFAKNEELHDHSVLIDCSTCPRITDDEFHKIAYSDSPAEASFHSEPIELNAIDGLGRLLEIIQNSERAFKSVGELRELFPKVRKQLGGEPSEISPQENLEGWIQDQQEFFFVEGGINLTFITHLSA